MSTEDYDSRADKLWSIYNKEAEGYDKALMEAWKEDMDSIIIFAGLFSSVLTAFLVDASTRLQADPTDQTNALLNQTVFLLAHISQQLGPNGSQTNIALPQPLEPFKLNPSDLRVNIFWFMSLGCSITAALGATLVQQWVRDYLQVFQRFSGSLERSRMRQFLFHGLASNYMHLLVECIPTFIHISLFLFFIGLADNLFSTNKVVAITMTVIIGFCVFFYIACSIFPVLYAKTPFHTPLSHVFWKMRQIIYPRKYHDRDTGKFVSVSPDMVQGHWQLAMGHSDDRKMRDREAIHWVLTKITEDTEFEPFIVSIGASLTNSWAKDVWASIFMGNMDSTASNIVKALQIRIDSLLRSCAYSMFSDQQTRFPRACVCIDAVAPLLLSFEAGLKLDIDNDHMNDVLEYFGEEKKRREKPVEEAQTSSGSVMSLRQLPGNQVMDISLEVKWKCLLLIGMKKALRLDDWTAHSMRSYEECVDVIYKDKPITSGRAQEVDVALLKAWNAAQQLYTELHDSEIPEAQLTEVRLNKSVPHWRDLIEAMQESLDALNLLVDSSIDYAVDGLSIYLIKITRGALKNLGDIFSAWPVTNPVTTMFEGIDWGRLPPVEFLVPHLVPPRFLICQLLVCADPRRQPNFHPSTTRINLVGLGTLLNNPEMRRLFGPQRAGGQSPQPYVNQFLRVKDIREHQGAGFIIEMFFATFRSLEDHDDSLTDESKGLIRATLRAITSTDDGHSEYFKNACRQFLWTLQQELPYSYKVEQIPIAAKDPSDFSFIPYILRAQFDPSEKT